jgi:hypothetical protein
MRNRWKVWAAGLALVLLVVGVGVVSMWPTSCEAERKAALVHEGLTYQEVAGLIGEPNELIEWNHQKSVRCKTFNDHSGLIVCFRLEKDGNNLVGFLTSARVSPPPPVHPLTRLRRTLARLIPALGD